MGSSAGGAGRAGRRTHYDYERATTRRGRLPESLNCTTDYRHKTGATRRTPPRSGRPPTPRPRTPLLPVVASIHSLRIQLFIRPARRTRTTRSAPPRERAARARAPPPSLRRRMHAKRPALRARPPYLYQSLASNL